MLTSMLKRGKASHRSASAQRPAPAARPSPKCFLSGNIFTPFFVNVNYEACVLIVHFLCSDRGMVFNAFIHAGRALGMKVWP